MTSTEVRTPERTEGRKKFLHYVFTTALEGGINYWAQVLKYRWSKDRGDGVWREDIDGFHAKIRPAECDWENPEDNGWGIPGLDRELIVDINVIELGTNLLVDKVIEATKSENSKAPFSREYLRQFVVQWLTDGDDGDSDSSVCDLIVQLGLFGQVMFG